MEKITKREMFEAIIAMAAAGEMKYDKDVYIDFCQNEIDLLDKKAIKAKETAAKKKSEPDELTIAVQAVLSEETFETIADITARIEGDDVTVSKVQARLKNLVDSGIAEKQQISVPGSEGQKARKLMAYRLIAQ